jgi:hypothetical protein
VSRPLLGSSIPNCSNPALTNQISDQRVRGAIVMLEKILKAKTGSP